MMVLVVREEDQVSEHTFNVRMDDHWYTLYVIFRPGARRKRICRMLSEHKKNTSMSRFHTEQVRMKTEDYLRT